MAPGGCDVTLLVPGVVVWEAASVLLPLIAGALAAPLLGTDHTTTNVG
jgi:hypothetical protein